MRQRINGKLVDISHSKEIDRRLRAVKNGKLVLVSLDEYESLRKQEEESLKKKNPQPES